MKTSNGMKNKLLLSAMVVALGVLPAISLAQTGASSTIKGQIEARKEALKQEVASRTDAIKNSLEERKQSALGKIREAASKYIQTIIERFDAATGRLEKLADRIDSRIAKIEARNIDETAAKTLLAAARAKIETAKTSTLAITNNIASSTATSTAALKKDYEVVKAEIQKAKDDIRAAHAALVDVVSSLKPGDNKLKNSASATATSTATSTATTTKNND